MKNILILLLSIIFFASSCNDDEVVVIEPGQTSLNYDGNNFSAPVLPQDKYEAAVRFTPSETGSLTGQFLKEVQIYFVSVPATTEVIIYGAGNANSPGSVLYSADISTVLSTDNWNTHVLSTPVEITGEDLWISIKVDHPAEFGSVGCDTGPADTNGDFLFVNSDNNWTNLRTFTSQATNINWNVRGIVEE